MCETFFEYLKENARAFVFHVRDKFAPLAYGTRRGDERDARLLSGINSISQYLFPSAASHSDKDKQRTGPMRPHPLERKSNKVSK